MNVVGYIKKNGIKRVFDVFYHYTQINGMLNEKNCQ